ncbi:MAG: hypothetical protein CL816_05135 [Coxiellaceae bacterium]|nr:hypothetical protein [Coxiellaceae bacterium]
MHDLTTEHAAGVLQYSWRAVLGDYAIAGGWSINGKNLVVADSAGDVYLFDGLTGKVIWTRQNVHAGGLLTLGIHPNGNKFVTTGQDGRAVVSCCSRGQVLQDIDVGCGWVENLAWSHDGHWLAASCGRQVSVYDDSGKKIWLSEEHPSTVSAIDWWSSQELATTCYGRVAFFDMPTGKLNQQLNWKGSLISMVLRPNSDIVACASQDNSVHFWRRSTGQDSTISGYSGKPSTIVFNKTGSLLATTGSENVTLWSFQGDGPEGTEPDILAFHEKYLTTLAFSHDGMYLASGSRDGVVVVWLIQPNGNSRPIGISLLEGSVVALYWRQDDRVITALDSRGGVTSWNLE